MSLFLKHQGNLNITLQQNDLMQTTETLEIEEYLRSVSEQELPELSEEDLLIGEDEETSAIPREYQSAFVTFESPLMEYIRNLREKTLSISKELSFISSIYSLTVGQVVKIIDEEQGEVVKNDLFTLLSPLAENARSKKGSSLSSSSSSSKQHISEKGVETNDEEIEQILSRCFLVLFSNFSQMQAAIIQGIIYDIERQGVHLPVQSSNDPETISQQYRPIVQNQAVVIRNMFRHLFPQYNPPDNIHILELCFLSLLEQIQHNFQSFLLHDEQLLQMLSRVKVAQDELLNVKDPQLRNILAKMDRIQNRIHDIYNQRWRDGILNDMISTFFYHARFIAYLENKGKISQKRRYFLASLKHLLNNYEDFYHETLLPQVDLLTAEYKRVDKEGTPFIEKHIKFGKMEAIFQTVLDEDRFSVLSEMIVTGDFSKARNYNDTLQYIEELEKMHKELVQKHRENEELISYVNHLWETLDDLQELIISEIFTKWKEQLTTVLKVYCQELFWFHGCFSTYTVEAFPNRQLLFEKLEAFITLYEQVISLFSDNILYSLESLSQQVYAFRDRVGDFNLLYTGILDVELRSEEKHFQFELYTPAPIKELAKRLSEIQDRYIQALEPKYRKKANIADIQDDEKNRRLYIDEVAKIATYIAEERDMLMYCGSRRLFTGPQFEQDDFAHLYNEVIAMYERAINQLQLKFLDPLDSIIELKSLRELAQFDVVYERYTEAVKYRALRKAWKLIRRKGK